WSISSSLSFKPPPTSELYTLSLHDALPISLNTVIGGTAYNVTSPQGIVDANGNYNILAHGNATNIAGFLSASWRVNQWIFDASRSEEHTSELQSLRHLVCRLLLEKKKKQNK